MRRGLYESLIDRCFSESLVSGEPVLTGESSLVAWRDDDRWCQREKDYLMDQPWRNLTMKNGSTEFSLTWSNGPGLVSSSLSWDEIMVVSAWMTFLTSRNSNVELWHVGCRPIRSCLIKGILNPAFKFLHVISGVQGFLLFISADQLDINPAVFNTESQLCG